MVGSVAPLPALIGWVVCAVVLVLDCCYGTGFHDKAEWIYLSVRLHATYLGVATEWF